MFKIVICLILIVSCGGAGVLKSQTFSRRVAELKELRDMIYMMKTEISYMKDPLPVIFERLGNSRPGISSEIPNTCSELMKDNQDMQYSWCCAVDMAARNSSITGEDKAVIYDLGAQLGKSSVQGQIELLQMTDEKLQLQIRIAEEQKRTKGKMYAGLGFSIGTVLTILLI